jgi:hypothetical protein
MNRVDTLLGDTRPFSKALAALPLLFLVLPLLGCRNPRGTPESVIYRPGQVGEPAAFWAELANNADLEASCRRVCVLELFRRHVQPGMSLDEVADILDGPTWLEESDVTDFAQYSGYVPLPLTQGDGDFGIHVLARPLERGWIMIKVKGICTKAQFVSALKGRGDNKIRDASIVAIAVLEPNPKY